MVELKNFDFDFRSSLELSRHCLESQTRTAQVFARLKEQKCNPLLCSGPLFVKVFNVKNSNARPLKERPFQAMKKKGKRAQFVSFILSPIFVYRDDAEKDQIWGVPEANGCLNMYPIVRLNYLECPRETPTEEQNAWHDCLDREAEFINSLQEFNKVVNSWKKVNIAFSLL